METKTLYKTFSRGFDLGFSWDFDSKLSLGPGSECELGLYFFVVSEDPTMAKIRNGSRESFSKLHRSMESEIRTVV